MRHILRGFVAAFCLIWALVPVAPAISAPVTVCDLNGIACVTPNKDGSIPTAPSMGSAGSGPTTPLYAARYQPSYYLLGSYAGGGAAASGLPVGPIYGGTYVYQIYGSFAGCTAKLNFLANDGQTMLTQYSDTVAAVHTVQVGSPLGPKANVQVTLTGCTGLPNLWGTLAWVG